MFVLPAGRDLFVMHAFLDCTTTRITIESCGEPWCQLLASERIRVRKFDGLTRLGVDMKRR